MTSFSNRCSTHTLPLDNRARFLAASITRGETSEWSTATSSLSYIDQPHSLANGLSHGPFLCLYDEPETSATPEAGPEISGSPHPYDRPSPVPGIQSVPASG